MYNPYPERLRQTTTYFEERASTFPGLTERLVAFGERQDLGAARELLTAYFAHHRQGDIRGLRQVTSVFADKRVALRLVDAVLGEEAELRGVAARSYPHPIGFDKLVLHDAGGKFKLRLHVYWRSPQELATELIHLHKFEMASSPITGELTNHLYAVRGFEGPKPMVTSLEDGPSERFQAYTGYERDADGTLHKRHVGSVELVRKSVLTFVPGQTYAQELEYPHFVETNAETGHTNGDVCSTIYIHGPGLTDAAGRRLPLLLERERVPDSTVEHIPSMSPEQLESSLRRYRGLLQESLNFYDWLYAPKYGRNLSVGLVAGYFLSEAFGTVRTVEMWARHRQACVEVLRAREERLLRLIRREESLDALTERDRTARYFQQLINKSWEHPDGQRAWFAQYGDLTKEFERYLGALVGDYARDPNIQVLKPIWNMSTSNLQGGAHYGHIWAMLEAVRKVEPLVLGHFRAVDFTVADTAEGPVTEVDRRAQAEIRKVLVEHFPHTAFEGEEGRGKADAVARRRWLVDPIDGTRNFIHGNKNFGLSLAHQQLTKDVGGAWTTTDAVVSLPAHAEVYWAERGQGAWHIDAKGVERRMRVRRPSGDALSGQLIDLSVRGLGLEAELKLTELLMRRGAVRRASGSAAMAFCMVGGCGNTGAIVTANDYDVAAGLLVAREAGATVSQLTFEREGRAFTAYLAGESEATHAALRGLLDEALASSRVKVTATG